MIKISDKIYINLDETSTPETVLKVLTYRNPEYYQKKEMGISLWDVPKEIKTYEIKDRELIVTRGEALKIKPFFTPEQWNLNFDHTDHPVKLQYINNDFDLDEYQDGAVAAMKKKHQGVVHAVTSAGKSLIICKAIAEIGQRALIVVHRKILMEQLLADIDKYIRDENGNKIKVGRFGNGSKTVGDITIGIDKTLTKETSNLRDMFGVLILDECHLTPARTISNLINAINTRRRYGLTGTLKRKDQKEFLIFSTFGKVIHTINKEELLEKGRVVPVEIRIMESRTRFDWDQVVTALDGQGHKNPTQGARHLQEQAIANSPERRKVALERVQQLYKSGQKTLVLSRYVAPCYELQAQLQEEYGIESGIITGKDSKGAVEAYKAMKEGDSKVIFATVGCVSTGVSISDLDNIVLISPIYTNELLLHQIRGRLMRTAEGKTHGTLWYIYDPYIFTQRKLNDFIKIMKK